MHCAKLMLTLRLPTGIEREGKEERKGGRGRIMACKKGGGGGVKAKRLEMDGGTEKSGKVVKRAAEDD